METDIRTLIKRFMDGQTSLEEESRLADYLRTHDVGEDLLPYKQMFAWFDEGMPLKRRRAGKLTSRQATLQPSQSSHSSRFSRKVLCLIAAAAAAIALLLLVAWPKAEPQLVAENTPSHPIPADNELTATTDTLTADTTTAVAPKRKTRRRRIRTDRYKPMPPKVYVAEARQDTAANEAELLAEEKIRETEKMQKAIIDSIYNEHRRIEESIELYITAMENYDVEDEYY